MKLRVISDNGRAVDWFFMYKLPSGATDPTGKSTKTSSGYEYVYFDAKSTNPPALSEHTLKKPSSALFKTVNQVFQPGSTHGRIFYNDEKPRGSNNENCGHAKGVLAFDTKSDSAFWLLHSTPKFPITSNAKFPVSGHGNGQTFLCVSLDGVDQAEQIAQVMRQQQPQTYGCIIPKSLGKNSSLRLLSESVDLDSEDQPVSTSIETQGGNKFRLFAKNKAWNNDLWRNLVAIGLNVDVDVETWRRLELSRDARGGKESKTGKQDVEDVRYINLEHIGIPFEWRFTKDHAKLGTSKEYDWVIVADINRDKSQSKRGGGCACLSKSFALGQSDKGRSHL